LVDHSIGNGSHNGIVVAGERLDLSLDDVARFLND
jgi:hypothetical protein